MQDENLYNDLEKLAKENNMEIFKISAVTGEGISELLKRVYGRPFGGKVKRLLKVKK